MWGRVIEIMLGLWLVISPFIFGHYPSIRPLWINDFACGTAIVLLACLSFWRPLRHTHVLILGIAFWLIGFAYVTGGYPAAPGFQNDILLGLTVMLMPLIPNQASQPPLPWRQYYQRQAEASPQRRLDSAPSNPDT
jgi:hypothetical protein